MPKGKYSLPVLMCIMLTNAAQACDLATNPTGTSPIETRKPVSGDEVRLTSGFGIRRHPLLDALRMHTGIDWAAPTGTPVTAAGVGRVAFAATKDAYGNMVLIDHGSGWHTLYSQLDRLHVREGDCVEFGARIGDVGTTGLSTGPHLHFEVQHNGVALDPMRVRVRNSPPEDDEKK